MKTLKSLMEKHPKLSLKRICDETNLCYQYVLKSSKQPIIGKTYDPKDFNYTTTQKILDKRNIDLSKYDWVSIEQSIKTFEPIDEIKDFVIDVEFKMRTSSGVCKVIYLNTDEDKNVLEIVFLDYTTSKVRVMNVDTFIHQSPRIVK